MKKILYTSPDEIHYTKMDDDVREEKKYLVCADSSMSGNYTLFFYGDGYLTAYNDDAKVEHYFAREVFETKFLKNDHSENCSAEIIAEALQS